MTPLHPNETDLTGHWQSEADKMVADDTCRRIQELIAEQLVKVAVDSSGWRTLYQDPQDSRLWEHTYPQGEMQGGGPPRLSCISAERVPNRRFRIMSVLADVIGLFSIFVGPFSRNVGRSRPMFSANLGQKSRCYRAGGFTFSGRFN
jgi:hypothetical protein